ncbi:hypothetical protein JTB14_011098 [Gonioctena quinquepunctata]|nr:hypothetical protein JTB14_011098 [Gonioctena quinquepunctata]
MESVKTKILCRKKETKTYAIRIWGKKTMATVVSNVFLGKTCDNEEVSEYIEQCKLVLQLQTIGNVTAPIQISQPLRSTSPWDSINIIMDDSEGTQKTGEYSFSQDLVTESGELSNPASEVTTISKRSQILPERIPVVQQRITASKNETPPLKKKRKRNEESDIMTKLGSAFDNFSSYMET